MAARTEHEPTTGVGEVGSRVEQACLPDPADTLDEDEVPDTGTGFRPQAIQRGDLVLATDECRTLWPWPPSARLVARLAICLTGQRLLAQDREMEPGGIGRGVDPQLVAEPGRQFVVRRERCCGRTLTHQRAHQVAHGSLVVRIGGHCVSGYPGRLGGLAGRHTFGEQMASTASQVVGLPTYPEDPVGVGLVRQRGWRSEEVQGPPCSGGSQRGLPGRQPAGCLVRQRAGLVEVDGARLAGDAVRASGGGEHALTEQPSAPADQGGDVGGRVGGRRRGPEGIDHPVEGDHAAALRGQQCEQRPGLAAAQVAAGQRSVCGLHRQHRAQPDPHTCGHDLPPDPVCGQYRRRGQGSPASREAAVCRCRRAGCSGAPVQRGDPHVVRRCLRGPDERAEWCLGCDLGGPPCPRGRSDRLRQDPLGLPVVDRPTGDRAGPGEEAPLPRALRLAAQGARRRCRAQPAGAAGRHPADRRTARGGGARGQGGRAVRRHESAGPAPDPDRLLPTS